MFFLAGQRSFAQGSDAYSRAVMAGLSNEGLHTEKPYLTAGDRTYIVGTQDGNFPDLGSHVPGEMGGLWMQPIKLIDGFWANLSETRTQSKAWLHHARAFINYPYGNRFIYAPVLGGIDVTRFQFCPQGRAGMVIQYQIRNSSARTRRLQLEFVVKTDLSPVWFSRENNIIDGVDSIYRVRGQQMMAAQDGRNPWYAVWGANLRPIGYNVDVIPPVVTKGMGKAASASYQLVMKPGEMATVVFVISGSCKSLQEAQSVCAAILHGYSTLLAEKKAYYARIIRRAAIDIPDKKLQQAYTWGKLNTEWLVSAIPGVGRFLGAGAIEYPWLFGCDNSYALQGVVATGDPALAMATLRLIKSVSEKVNGNGRIIHEMSSNGFVYNKGNSQETPHFALAVWKVFEWTGDTAFLHEMYPYIRKGIHWLLTEQDQNKDLFPEGYGIMEVRGLNAELIDVAVYTQQALEVASQMAALFGEINVQQEYAQKAALLKERIDTLFWDDAAGSYCDFYGSREQALAVAKGALEQLYAGAVTVDDSAKLADKKQFYENLVREFSALPPGTQRGWFTNKNWVISTPAETGMAPRNKAIRLLDKVRREDCGPYGPWLSAVEQRYMMTISTGVQAMAECAYGRTDQAMWYVDKIVQTFSRVLPGSISEMMPDYGCPVQAWTIYGLATPLVTHVLGVQPDAYRRNILLSPHLPTGWDHGCIYELPVGNNSLSFTIQKREGRSSYLVRATSPGWTYTLHIDGVAGKRYRLNGKVLRAATDDITLKGTVNKVEVLQGL